MLGAMAAALLVSALAGACGSGRSSSAAGSPTTAASADPAGLAWPAPTPDRVIELAKAAGLVPETHESLEHHVHAHLDVYIDGQRRTVPAGIGIVITDPAVHRGVVLGQPAYGGITECAQPCISPLHTHDVTGILHTESASFVDNTLGQFFKEWGVKLGPDCVGQYCASQTPSAVYVNGGKVALADAPGVPLTDQEEIAVVIGRPPAHIPPHV